MPSAGSIYVDLLLKDGNYVAGWNRARNATRVGAAGVTNELGKISSSFTALLNPLNTFSNALQNIGLAVAASLSVEKIIKYSDTWKQVSGRLSLVVKDTNSLVGVQESLYKIAQETRQPLADIVNFYSRLNQFIPETERAQYDLLGVTRSVSASLAITGEQTISAQAALIQFTQGIGTNFRAAGQELRSLQELAPRLTQALQNAIGGGSRSLQELVKSGELTRQTVLNALSGMGVEGQKLREELAKIPVTVGQALTQLDNAFLKTIGRSGELSSATGALAKVIKALADNLDSLIRQLVLFGSIALGIGLVKLTSSFLSVASGAAKAGIAAAAYTAAVGKIYPTERMAAAIAKLSAAAAGGASKLGESVIVVGRSGTAAVAAVSGFTKLRAAVSGLTALVGGPYVVALAAGYAALQYFGDKSKVIASEELLQKALEDTTSLFGGYAQASKKQQAEILQASYDRQKVIEDEFEKYSDLFEKASKLSSVSLAWNGILSRFTKVTGIDASALGVSGIGQTQGELAKLLVNSQGVIKSIEMTRSRATEAARATATANAKALSDELQAIFDRYEQYIEGVSKDSAKYNKAKRELDKLVENKVISPGQEATALQNYAESFGVWYKSIEDTGKSVAQALHTAFSDFFFDPFENGLQGMASSFVKTLQRMWADLMASQLLTGLGNLFGITNAQGVVTSSSIGSALSSAGSSITKFLDTNFSGWFADGGIIPSGQWGVVGEDGPELAFGGTSGQSIVPLGAASGNAVTYNIDARGADIGVAERISQILKEVTTLRSQVPAIAVNSVRSANLRGKL